MSAASYVGRIGGLAVALGVGAAVFTGGGIACAQPAGSGSSSGSDASASGTHSSSGTGSDSDKTSTGTKTSKDAATTEDATTSTDATTSDEPVPDATTGKKRRHGILADILGGHRKDSTPTPDPETSEPETPSGDSSEVPAQSSNDATDADAAPKPGRHRLWSTPTTAPTSSAAASGTSATIEVAATPAKKTPLSFVSVQAPQTATTTSTLSAVSTSQDSQGTTTTEVTTDVAETSTASVSTPLANLVKKLVDAFSGNSPSSPAAVSPFAWVLAAASRRELSGNAVNASAQVAATSDPVMVLNGYNVVAAGDPLYVGSYYGMFTNFPGFQGVVQGEQDFDLVNPNTGDTVGSFHGLVSQNKSIGSNTIFTQIAVTEVTGPTGTTKGLLPPVGSVLSSYGTGRYGTMYAAMPTASGDVISYKSVTPFGTFKMWTPYDAAGDLTNYVSFNRPIKTADGFYLAPTVDNSADMMSITGFPPLFTAVQGRQVFSVYDDAGNEVGKFEGLVTVTSDIIGTYTEAVYVTDTLSGNVGTAAGDTPPVGTVYNVIYFHSDDLFAVYSAKPDPAGNVFSTKLVNPRGKATDIDIKFDAASPPVRTNMVVPGDYTLIPIDELQIIGINGLPPREAILQGYQQLGVYDKNGVYLGTVNADRTSQWDVDGNSTEAVVVTGIAEDAGVGGIPPIGSVFNFSYTGTTGFGQAYYALPGEARDKVVYKYVTPFGGIPLPSSYDAAKGLSDYDYYSPFASLENSLLSAPLAAAGATAGLLGASQLPCDGDALSTSFVGCLV